MTPEQLKALQNNELAIQAMHSWKLGLLTIESAASLLKQAIGK